MHIEPRIAERNVRLFIAFRVLFNARFYYPIFAVMFLDYGLSIEQFALLNVVWAFAIVLLEVPLGAVADHIGRKKTVVAAAFLMVVEMALLAFVPLGDPRWVFLALVANRILSGAAEACASGADEALAYDSLGSAGRRAEWPAVLAKLARVQSIGFVVTMIVGAAVYDPHLMNGIAGGFGWHPEFSQHTTLRFPAYLTLGSAILACAVTLGMKDPHVASPAREGEHAVVRTLSIIRGAALWIWRTPAAMVLILAGLFGDSIIRLFLTIGSNYYRLIELPEASFGLIGAAFSFLGFFTASLSRRLAERGSALRNFALVAFLTWAGLLGAAAAWPLTGLVFVFMLGVAFSFLNFFLSHYLNQIVESSRRATVLSFKSMAMNLAYGAVGLMYAGLVGGLSGPDVFARSLFWLPWYFAATMGVLGWTAWRKLKRA